jgi:hypothetical protein
MIKPPHLAFEAATSSERGLWCEDVVQSLGIREASQPSLGQASCVPCLSQLSLAASGIVPKFGALLVVRSLSAQGLLHTYLGRYRGHRGHMLPKPSTRPLHSSVK